MEKKEPYKCDCNCNKQQYALWKPGENSFLIDANEYYCIEKAIKKDYEVTEVKSQENKREYVIALGTYMFQHNETSESKEKTITDYIINNTHTACTPSGWILMDMVDLVQYNDCAEDKNVPVAVLLQTDYKVFPDLSKGDQAMTCFVRYDEMSYADNILNRPGLYSLKKFIEVGKDDTIIDTWTSNFTKEQVLAAHKLKWKGYQGKK